MLLETDLKGMFILKQVSKENLYSLLNDVTQVIPGYCRGSGLDKGTFPVTQNLLGCHCLSFLTLRHLRTNVIVYRENLSCQNLFPVIYSEETCKKTVFPVEALCSFSPALT